MSRLVLVLTLLFLALPAMAQDGVPMHGIAMHGDLKYGPDFQHFEYADPNAPKGGEMRFAAIGGFDSLNPYILKGEAAAGLANLFETLMTSPADEAFSEYGLIAESIETPPDRSWAIFTIRPEARWHDGEPITVADVIFSFTALRDEGTPFYRYYYRDVASVEAIGERRVKFVFAGEGNRELPLIVGQMPVLPKHYFDAHPFGETSLDPPIGSGPYRIATVDPGRSITYERVADYWGAALPVNRGRYNVDRLVYDYYRDPTIALEAFKAHEFDIHQENVAKQWATGYDSPALATGLIVREEIPNELPNGMQGYAFNTRLAMFQDRRVRAALALAFDFEWINKNLFFSAYTRTSSYFANSELAATGVPGPAELALLEPFRDQVPPEVFGPAYLAPVSDGSGSDRRNLRAAKELLAAAGWVVKGGVLTGPDGTAMTMEFLINQPAFERVTAAYIQNLERLGVKATIRQVDSSQYEQRLEQFDFDVDVVVFGQSLSPGNEQQNFWTSTAADQPGSSNIIGIKDPAVDALVEAIVAAEDRAALVTACRALDRVLTWSHYVVPHWHNRTSRIAYWNKFSRPPIDPKYGVDLDTWWVEPAKEATLEAGEQALR